MTPEDLKNELDNLAELTKEVRKTIASRMKAQRMMMGWLIPAGWAIIVVNVWLSMQNVEKGSGILAAANIISIVTLLGSQVYLIKSYLRLRKQAQTIDDYERMVNGKQNVGR